LACFIHAVWISEVLKEVLLKNQCVEFMISPVFMWFLDMFYFLFRNYRFLGTGCFHSSVKVQFGPIHRTVFSLIQLYPLEN